MNKCLISVLIPLYNSEKYIEKCLDSIIEQNNGKIEIIILNDGSTDSSLNIVERKAKDNNFIRVYTQENKKNIYQVRKKLIEYASGDYILFVDSDDELEKNAINSLTSIINNKYPDMILFDYNIVNNGKIKESKMQLKDKFTNNICEELMREYFTSNRYYSLWIKCFKKSLFLNSSLFNDYKISIGEDAILCMIATIDSHNIEVLQDKLYRYRVDGQGISYKYKLWYYYDFKVLYNFMLKLIEEKNLDETYVDMADKYYITLVSKFFSIFKPITKEEEDKYLMLLDDINSYDRFKCIVYKASSMGLFYKLACKLIMKKNIKLLEMYRNIVRVLLNK